MSEKRTIYVVTSGSYSDYGIVAVFDRKDLAEALVAGCLDEYNGYQIEEYPLNPGETEYHAGRSLWSVEMRRDGTVNDAIDLGFAHTEAEGPSAKADFYEWQMGQPLRLRGMELRNQIWATGKEQAIKATNEVRAQWIADGRWDQEEARIVAENARYER